VLNASEVSYYVRLDDTSSVLEAGRLQYLYFRIPCAQTLQNLAMDVSQGEESNQGETKTSITEKVTGIGIYFGDLSDLLTLVVVPLTSPAVTFIATLSDGSCLVSVPVKTPSGICSTSIGEANSCSATNVYAQSVTSLNNLAPISFIPIDIACGNVCALGNSACSTGCSQCNAGSTVAGADTPVSRRFDMGSTSATFTFNYETYTLKDQIRIWNDEVLIFDSGCVGTQGERVTTVSFSSQSQVIRVDVQPDCECPTCTGTAWYFRVSCPTCKPKIQVDGVDTPSGSDIYISSVPAMPSIVAYASGCDPTMNIAYKVDFIYKAPGTNAPPPFTASFTSTGNAGAPFDITALLGGQIYGGTMVISYSGVASGVFLFYVKGTNPSPSVITTYISSLSSSWYLIPIARQESSLRQFTADGTPLLDSAYGFGVFQLTNPKPTLTQIYDWKANIQQGVNLLGQYAVTAASWVTKQENDCRAANNGVLIPIPSYTDGKCTFTASGSQTFVDAVTIKRYNGASNGNYLSWNNGKWQFNNLNSNGIDYVHAVCEFVGI